MAKMKLRSSQRFGWVKCDRIRHQCWVLSKYTHSRTLTVILSLLDPTSLQFLSALQPARTLCPSYRADDTLESDHW